MRGLLLALTVTSLVALDDGEAVHLLSRTGFGATPAAVAALRPLDRIAAVEAVLASGRGVSHLNPPSWCAETLAAWKEEHDAAYKAAEALPEREKRAAQDKIRQERGRQKTELKAWWFAEMATTPSPLTERMVLFWHNHFTSQFAVVEDPRLMYAQNALLRQHALGNFAELCLAIPFDPAMFRYLDSNSNLAYHPNENFAREVMELFTVGEGAYSEADIKEAARAFSGYHLDDNLVPQLSQSDHDFGRKTVLGHSGNFDATKIMEILLTREENVALHISRKLWLHFVDEQPDEKVVYAVAADFYKSKYEITAALRTLLLSDAFWQAAGKGTLVKGPADLIVGWCRQNGMTTPDAAWCVGVCRRLGQDLMDPPNVKGWHGGRSWISTQSYLDRASVITELLAGRAAGSSLAWSVRSGDVSRPKAIQALRVDGNRTTVADQLGVVAPWLDQAPLSQRQAMLLVCPPVQAPAAGADASAQLAALIRDPVWNLR